MPIITPSTRSFPVFYPKTNYAIVKYIDLQKFISLLYKQSLFFCRVDKLEDKFEGTTAEANFASRVNYYKHLRTINFFDNPMSDEKIIETVKYNYESEKKFRSINCVNCWNKMETESAALWKIYSDFGKGIMIKSSISNLVKSMEITEEEIHLSEISYLDYDKDVMPDGNTMFPFIHKQKAYSYEQEIRLIYEIKTQDGWDYDWSKSEVEEGIYLKTDLDKLIEEIIVGPYSPRWFYKMVEDILIKYGLKKPINKSVLTKS